MDLSVPLPVIGIVHTSHAELEATPIQAGLNRAERAEANTSAGAPWVIEVASEELPL